MTALVTGAAGFVGSHLVEALLAAGQDVRAVDCLTPYYPPSLKRRNLEPLRSKAGFDLVEADLAETPLEPLLDGADLVFHLSGQPGVRPSWGAEFATYVRNNIQVTQRLLEAARDTAVDRFVYASSSSVYGDAESYPTPESIAPRPSSPYGVTKLAAEHLCELYRRSFGVPTISLRLFTVYGPRQRPDMAFARLVRAAVRQESFELYGDGEQTRDFTFVSDVVRAMQDAAASEWVGVANVGGGARTSMNQVVRIVEELCGPIDLRRRSPQAGDVRHTAADIGIAASAFGYAPRTSLAEGLAAMVAYERTHAEMVAP
jgi:nucleoside-diphosphate-sugar epimerase